MRVQFLRYFGEDQEYIDKIRQETGVTIGQAAAVQLTKELKEQNVTAIIEPDTYRPGGGTYLIAGAVDVDCSQLQKAYDAGVAGEWQMI